MSEPLKGVQKNTPLQYKPELLIGSLLLSYHYSMEALNELAAKHTLLVEHFHRV